MGGNSEEQVRYFDLLTLDDKLIRDGLVVVSLLNRKEPYYLVGGIATQTYIPSYCRRRSTNIDFSIARPLTYNDFRLMAVPLIERLRDMGYETKTGKRHWDYSISFISKQGNGSLLKFPIRNEREFKKKRRILEREFENANVKILEGENISYAVARSEDITIPKLVRSADSLKRNSSFYRLVPSRTEPLSLDEIGKMLKKINELRRGTTTYPPDYRLAKELRFISDIYDIRVLSETAGLNERYLKRVVEDRDIFTKNRYENTMLIRSLLPISLEN